MNEQTVNDFNAFCASYCTLEAIEQLCREGIREITIHEPVLLSPDIPPEVMVQSLRVLRDLTACHVDIVWYLGGSCALQATELCHLVPPTSGDDAKFVSFWKRLFKVGSFYWRNGPGFVTVKDTRESKTVLLTIDDPLDISVFIKASQGYLSVGGTAEENESARALIAEGVILQVDNLLLALPYRMRHWPVPFRAF